MEIAKITDVYEKDMEILGYKKDPDAAVRASLTIQGACTSRGILEYYLNGVAIELGVKEKFNARLACEEFFSKLTFYSFI